MPVQLKRARLKIQIHKKSHEVAKMIDSKENSRMSARTPGYESVTIIVARAVRWQDTSQQLKDFSIVDSVTRAKSTGQTAHLYSGTRRVYVLSL